MSCLQSSDVLNISVLNAKAKCRQTARVEVTLCGCTVAESIGDPIQSTMIQNFQELTDRKKITKHGADWLRTALDPFHDYAQDFEGFPDKVSMKSRVQCVTSTHTISTPNPAAPTEFQARVWLCPWYSAAGPTAFRAVNSATHGEIDINTAISHGTFSGPVVIEAADNGVDLNSAPIAAGFTRTSIGVKPYPSMGRLIAAGFEVHNTTAAVYQSGTMTCSRGPMTNWQTAVSVVDTTLGTSRSIAPVHVVTLPSSDPTAAISVPGSTQWHASQGTYMVAHMAGDNLDVQPGYSQNFVDFTTGDEVRVNSKFVADTAQDAVTGFLFPSYYTKHGFDMPYALMTGLSAESTLTVTAKLYYETFPRAGSELVSMATPSPPLDYRALALYGMAAPSLPMAVPVNMNPGGEYFRMVMAAISAALKASAPLLGNIHPALPYAASAGSLVAQGLALPNRKKKPNNNNKRKPKKKAVGWGRVGGMSSPS